MQGLGDICNLDISNKKKKKKFYVIAAIPVARKARRRHSRLPEEHHPVSQLCHVTCTEGVCRYAKSIHTLAGRLSGLPVAFATKETNLIK